MTPDELKDTQDKTPVIGSELDIDSDQATILTSTNNNLPKDIGDLGKAVEAKHTLTQTIIDNVEKGDNITYVLHFYDDRDTFESEFETLVDGMKLSYDDIPIESERETTISSEEVEAEFTESDYTLTDSKVSFNPIPAKPKPLKAPFHIKKFVTLITDGIAMKIPFMVRVPEGYTGSIRSLIDNQARPGIYEYGVLERAKGSVIIEDKKEGK